MAFIPPVNSDIELSFPDEEISKGKEKAKFIEIDCTHMTIEPATSTLQRKVEEKPQNSSTATLIDQLARTHLSDKEHEKKWESDENSSNKPKEEKSENREEKKKSENS